MKNKNYYKKKILLGYKSLHRFDFNYSGFVRNDRSWHTVEPINIQEDYVRRSININFILEN